MWTSSLQLLLALVGLAIVATPTQANAFGARFSWVGISPCEKISPAFELSDVPGGTKRLLFEMRDLNVPRFHHGGSTIAYESNAVKKGAIRYIGPCPPSGERHHYRWTIDALDASGKVLGTATTTATFPP